MARQFYRTLVFIAFLISSTSASELGLGISGINFSTFQRNHFALYVSGNIQFAYRDHNNSYRNPLNLNMDFGWHKFEKNNFRVRLMSGVFISQIFATERYVFEDQVSKAINYEIKTCGIDVLALSIKLSITKKTGVFLYSNVLNVNLDFVEQADTEYILGIWSGSQNIGIYISF